MIKAQPLTIASDLVYRITNFIAMQNQPSEFEIKLIKRDIASLMKISPVEGWMVTAMFASMLNDSESAIKAVSNADKLDYNNPEIQRILAVVLDECGQYSESHAKFNHLLKISPNSSKNFDSAARHLISHGMIQNVADLVSLASARGIPFADDNPIVNFVETAIASRVDLEQLKIEVKLARTLLHRHGKIRINGNYRMINDDEDNDEFCLYVGFEFIGSQNEEINMNEELAIILSEVPNWNPSKLFVYFDAVEAM